MRYVVVLLILVAAGMPVRAQDKKRPNIVFIFTDDQRADTIAALGNAHIKTPNLDKLVRRGTAFKRAYCMGAMQGAVCVPSRAMVLSGRTLFKVNANLQGVPTWPAAFAKAGYRTFMTGKWHNEPASALAAFSAGKALFFGGMGDPYALPVADISPKRQLTGKKPSGKHSCELFADSAIDFIQKQKGAKEPFLAYIAFNGPHDPRTAPKEYHEPYNKNKPPAPPNFLPVHPFNNGDMILRDERLAPWPRTKEVVQQHLADYYAYITFVDAQVGRILEALRDAGFEDDTIVVFASDSGLAVGSHGLFGKQNLYDHSMRVPLIFAGPEVPQGKTFDSMCYLLDIFPTLGEFADVKGPDGSEGLSLRPVLRGVLKTHRDSIFTAYRQFQRSVRDNQYHLIVYPHINKVQLFDVANDPHELKDLAKDPNRKVTIATLTDTLKDWQKKLGDKQPLRSDKPMPAEFDFSKVPPEEKKKKEKKGSPVVSAANLWVSASESQGFAALTPGLPKNIINPGKVELYPTHAAIGIEVPYTGDDNDNAQASFIWRNAGEEKWRNGVDMTFDRKRKLIWASIWPLEPGETINVKIVFTDPDDKNDTKLVWNGATTTRQFNFTPQGRTFYVSPAGDDADAGSKEKPFKTFAHAGKQLKPGDTLLALSGVYKEGDLLAGLKGAAEKPIVIAAAKNQQPILDSSLVIEPKSGSWTAVGDGVFATKPNVVGAFAPYVAQDKLRMFPYPALAELKADKQKVKRAWYWDEKARILYVRTGTGKEPDAHRYNVAQHAYGFHLTKTHHIVLRGLTMRYYGSVAVRLSEGAIGCVLYENTIHNSPGGIFMKSETTRDNAIWKNHIYELGADDFSWAAHYSIGYGNQAIYCDKTGRGNSFCHNVMHGYFDLIAVESWKNPDKLQYNRDCDIMFNTLSNATDDAIEVDGGGVNLRIHGNWIRNCQTAISLAPVERGPVYVTRNNATFYGLFIKFNVGGTVSHGWTCIYHNSAYSLIRGDDGGTGVSFAPNLPCTNKVLKNNVIVVNEWCVRAWRKGNTLDYNCYFHIPDRAPRRFQADKKTCNTIAEFAKATGQETHGLYADPQFTVADDAGGYPAPKPGTPLSAVRAIVHIRPNNMRLRPGSPCIDRGVVIRGINEEYRGKAPDIGAFEFDK